MNIDVQITKRNDKTKPSNLLKKYTMPSGVYPELKVGLSVRNRSMYSSYQQTKNKQMNISIDLKRHLKKFSVNQNKNSQKPKNTRVFWKP